MGESSALDSPPALDPERTSLFLDLDGTLARIEATPEGVGPDPARTDALLRLAERLNGRVAVLTGRSLEDADRILDQAVACVAGVHGLARRGSDGGVTRFLPSPKLDRAKQTLDAIAKARGGLIVEDKGASVALHFRQAPDAEEAVREVVGRLARSTGLTVQDGSMVSELRTAGPDKGDCLRAYMADPPFAGGVPIMVGDDLTDENGFAEAEALGGYGVLVGPPRPTRARYRLATPDHVLAWLGSE